MTKAQSSKATSAKQARTTSAPKKRRPSIKTRALSIINDAEQYDAETRHAIHNGLEKNYDGLADMVRRAEDGESVLDVSNPLPRPARDSKDDVPITYRPLEASAAQFGEYRAGGRFFAAILADPACPAAFRDLFGQVWTDLLLGSVLDKLGNPFLLPLTYAVVRDVMDASNLSGTAEGVHDTLVLAVETLVPEEVAENARRAMREEGASDAEREG